MFDFTSSTTKTLFWLHQRQLEPGGLSEQTRRFGQRHNQPTGLSLRNQPFELQLYRFKMAGKAHRGVLPVSELSLAEIGNSPSDGSEYLALVRAQTENLPGTVSIPRLKETRQMQHHEHALRKQFGVAHHFMDADQSILAKTKKHLLSNDVWRSRFVAWFSLVGNHVKLEHSNAGYPRPADIDAWRKRMYPMMTSRRNHLDAETEDPSELASLVELGTQAYISAESIEAAENGESEDELLEQADATDKTPDKTIHPKISTVASFSNPLCYTLLEYHLKWLPANPVDIPPSLETFESLSDQASDLLELQLQWIFHLLLRLVPDAVLVTPEQHALLRQLTRRLRWIRSKIHLSTHHSTQLDELPVHQQTIIAGLNMIIASTSLIFAQRDLCDP
jgi:hypothetical protein